MGGPIRFYQSNHLRVIFSYIAATLVSAMSVYLWCVYSFTYTAKGKKAYERKKNNEKKNGNKACVKYCCRNSPEGSYLKSWSNCTLPEVKPHSHELMDGFPCTGKENVDGDRIRLGLPFIFTQRQLLNLHLPARSRGRNRIPASCTDIKEWNMVQEEKRKNESQRSKQKAEG